MTSNLIEQLTNTANEHKNVPDAVLFDRLCKTVENYNKAHNMKLNPSREVNSFIAWRVRFGKVAA